MLVLSRKINEEIVLSGGIRIRVVDLIFGPNKGGRVRIGIDAPASIDISRPEKKQASRDGRRCETVWGDFDIGEE